MFDAIAQQVLAAPDIPARSGSNALTAAVSLAAALPDLQALTSSERALMKEWLERSITAL